MDEPIHSLPRGERPRVRFERQLGVALWVVLVGLVLVLSAV